MPPSDDCFNSKPVSDEWLNINFATGHHGNGSRIAVGIAENATDVHLYIVMKAIFG